MTETSPGIEYLQRVKDLWERAAESHANFGHIDKLMEEKCGLIPVFGSGSTPFVYSANLRRWFIQDYKLNEIGSSDEVLDWWVARQISKTLAEQASKVSEENKQNYWGEVDLTLRKVFEKFQVRSRPKSGAVAASIFEPILNLMPEEDAKAIVGTFDNLEAEKTKYKLWEHLAKFKEKSQVKVEVRN